MKIVTLVTLVLVMVCATSSYAQDGGERARVGGEIDISTLIRPISDAKALLAQRKFVAAEKAFRALDPKFLQTEVKVGLGEAILGQKRFGEALEVFESVTPAERKSQQVPFQLRYGIVLYAVGRRQEALNLYADSVKDIPGAMQIGGQLLPLSFPPRTTTFRQFEVDARTAIAFSRLSTGGANDALPEAQRAIYLDPTHVLARCAEALALLPSKPELALKRFKGLEKTAPDLMKQEIEVAMPSLQEEAKFYRIQIDTEAQQVQPKALLKPLPQKRVQ